MASQSSKAGPSTSSSNSRGRFDYDVFLSFRGPDTRNNFAGLLHDRLCLKGIRAFFDEEDLHEGDRIDGILEAISRSQLHVPIFSQRYAESKWCLREVAKMVECCRKGGQERRIIPVFFDVDPNDVKHQSGPFEAAFQKHEEDKKDKVDEWKRALGYVGRIKGFHLNNGSQRELIQSITAEIQKILPTEMLLDEGEYTVGHEYRVEEMMKRLEFKAKDVRIIGIHGIGGIGKTTPAKAVYNRSHRFFGASSFIENVREESKSKRLVQIQKQLIQDISKGKIEKKINNVSQGTQRIMGMVGTMSVLLVLDDVDEEDQLKKLDGDMSRFHSGSRIIITTRHEAILKSARLQDEAIYRLDELDQKESLLLFQHHAFRKDETPEEYLKLSEEIVSISNGLPLVLEVFGSLFKTAETPKEWNKLLEELRSRQHREVHDKLRICYDCLKDNEKLIFLDIACLLVRKNKEDAIYMWEGHNLSPNEAIRSLQNKSLIKIKKGKFEMHDQIREMVREIVRTESLLQPEKCSRLWREGDIVEALRKSTESREENKVQGIILRDGSQMKSSTEAFEFMSELRILLNFAIFDQFDFRHFPASLKWLEWKNCLLETLQLDVKFTSIVVLNLSGSSISQLWSETTTGTGSRSISSKTTFDGLKVLDLSCCHCLYATPNFGMTPNLKRLIFDECSKLKEVDDSIESLKQLVSLSMRECVSLERLPNKIYELSSLEVFNLEGCSNLADFPQFSPTNSTNDLSKLGELILRDCESLESLPDLDKFKSLRILHIDGCQSLDHRRKHLFQDMKCEWDELIVSGSQTDSNWMQEFSFLLPIGSVNDPLLLQQLECYGRGDPSKNGTMKLCVRHKDMTNGRVLKNLETIHEAHFDGFRYTVNFGRNDKINEASRNKTIIMNVTHSSSSYLTEVVAKLQKASKFTGECMKPYVSMSSKRESPASWNSKREFSVFFNQSEEDKLDVNVIKYSTGLDERIANMISCRERSLHFGWTIEELVIFTLISGDINVTWYKQCSRTPSLPKVFVKLKVLDLSYCKFLAKTHDFAWTPHLEKLILDHCECLVEIGESVGELKKLILLSIVGCAKLDSLPCSIGSLENLQELILDDCTSLTRIPVDVGELKDLRQLSLKGCCSLEHLLDLQNLRSLKVLHIVGCPNLRLASVGFQLEDMECEYDELIISGRKAEFLNGEQEFSFELPIRSVNDPLLLQQLECYGHGDPRKNGTMKLCVRHEDMRNGRVLKSLETEAHFDDSVYKDKLFGCCYTVNFGRNDKINEASRSKTIIMKVTYSGSSHLTKVFAKLQKASKFTGVCMKPYVSISCKQEGPASWNSKPEFSVFFIQSEEDKVDVDVFKYSTGMDEHIERIANMISCKEQILHFGWTIVELKILTLLFSLINVTWYKQCSGTPLPPKVFVKMKVLDLSYCKFLDETHDFAQTPHLEKLILNHCERLVEIGQSIGQLKNLILLSIVGCANLCSLPCSIGSLVALEELNVAGCRQLGRIRGLQNLRSLKVLHIVGCPNLDLASIGFELKKAEFRDLEAFSISSRCCEGFFKKISFSFPRGGPLLVQKINVEAFSHRDISKDERINLQISTRRRLWFLGLGVLSIDALAVSSRNFTASFGKDDEINKRLRRLAASSDDDNTRVGTLTISCSRRFRLMRADIWFCRSPTPVVAD